MLGIFFAGRYPWEPGHDPGNAQGTLLRKIGVVVVLGFIGALYIVPVLAHGYETVTALLWESESAATERLLGPRSGS